MAALRLWSDELESFRAEARAMPELLPSVDDIAGDLPEDSPARALALRRRIKQLTSQFGDRSDRGLDSTIPGPAGELPVRLFLPDQPRAMLLHMHGGGWSSGDPAMADTTNDRMAHTHGLAVMSVDYRLAPEHPYPAAPDDCEAAALWMLKHGPQEWGTDRLLLAGESAGAHLALVTLLRLRDRHSAADRTLGANLVFGCYDLRGTPSVYGNGGQPDMLSSNGLQMMHEWFVGHLGPAERRDPDVSPLFADLRGLPPCLVSVGTADHLLDDSLFLAARLAAAESPVDLAVYPDAPHGFMAMPTKMTEAHNRRLDGWLTDRLR